MKERRDILLVILVLIQLAFLVTVLISVQGLRQLESRETMRLPTRFVLREPECANKLLLALGVENVRVLAAPNATILQGNRD